MPVKNETSNNIDKLVRGIGGLKCRQSFRVNSKNAARKSRGVDRSIRATLQALFVRGPLKELMAPDKITGVAYYRINCVVLIFILIVFISDGWA